MENTGFDRIDAIVASQKDFFRSGATLDIKFRKAQLDRFAAAVKKWDKALSDALWHDLHKSYQESYLTEMSLVLAEIRNHRSHVAKWSRRQMKAMSLTTAPAFSYVVKEPLGNALIIAPWNYPVQLLLNPLVGAISAGCTAVLKPSPYVPEVSRVIGEMIAETFPENYIACVQGNRDVNTHLLEHRFDVIFYTGSPRVARTVMAAAAKNLTPVVLELGGKSPCIIDRTADVSVAAKRIAWGKTINSGQTCIAPDYILIHKDVKDEFVRQFAHSVKMLHGDDIKLSPHYVRMVRDAAFDRVSSYIAQGKVLYGGRTDASERFIEPTLLDEVSFDSPVMQEEIFGPVFPVITLDDEGKSFADKVVDFVVSREKPLAFYYFGKDSDAWKIIGRTSAGGTCINDTVMHIVNDHLPFGGVGNSGMGSYHNKLSFDAFTHCRAVLRSPRHFDLPIRYMPYKLFDIVKHLI